jgi:hypothetical protein
MTTFFQSYLMGNPLLLQSRRDKVCFDTSIFTNNNDQCNELVQLKIKDFFDDDDSIKSIQSISDMTGVVLSNDNYEKFRVSLIDSKYLAERSSINIDTQSLSLDTFITRFKKGSRSFRKVLGRGVDSKIKCKNKGNIKTFFRLIELEIPDESELKKPVLRSRLLFRRLRLRLRV